MIYKKIYQLFLQRVVRDNLSGPEIKFYHRDYETYLRLPDLEIKYFGPEHRLEALERGPNGDWTELEFPTSIEETEFFERISPNPTYVCLESFDTVQVFPSLDISILKELTQRIVEADETQRSDIFTQYVFMRKHPNSPKFIQNTASSTDHLRDTLKWEWAHGHWLLRTHRKFGDSRTEYTFYSPHYTALIPRQRSIFSTNGLPELPEPIFRPAYEIYEEGGVDGVTMRALEELLSQDPFATLKEWTWLEVGRSKIKTYELYE